MALRIRKKLILEYALLSLFAFYVFVAHWIWYGRGIQETLLIIISVMILAEDGIKNKNGNLIRMNQLINLIVGILIVLYAALGVLRAKSHAYLMADLKAMIGPIFVSLAVIISIKRFLDNGNNILQVICKFLNIYFIINNIIIIIQYFIPYFLMNKSAISAVHNSSYFDQLTGFIGINGTTRWDMWSIVLIVLNFQYAKLHNSKRMLQYNIFLIFLSCIIAMLNSARAFFVFMPIVVLIYFFTAEKVSVSKRMKQILAILAILIIAIIIYLVNPFIKTNIDHLIDDKISMYATLDLSFMITSNDDRARALQYAIVNGGKYGIGIGAVPMHSTSSTVKYIGLNSTSSYIYMLGIYGYFIWSVFLTKLLLFSENNRIYKFLIYFLLILCSGYLLPVYSSFAMLSGLAIILYLFSLKV